jgi:hypothetical protein
MRLRHSENVTAGELFVNNTDYPSLGLSDAAGIFGAGAVESATDRERIRELHAKIGELTVERDFLDSALGRFPGPSGRR